MEEAKGGGKVGGGGLSNGVIIYRVAKRSAGITDKGEIFWTCSTSHLVLYDNLLPGWRFESQHCIVL